MKGKVAKTLRKMAIGMVELDEKIKPEQKEQAIKFLYKKLKQQYKTLKKNGALNFNEKISTNE